MIVTKDRMRVSRLFFHLQMLSKPNKLVSGTWLSDHEMPRYWLEAAFALATDHRGVAERNVKE